MPTFSAMRDEILSLILAVILCSAVRAGDDPCSATILPTDNASPVHFDNSVNGFSAVEAPPLGGLSGADTWIAFTMPASGSFYLLMIAGTMSDPAIAIYGGDCSDPQLLYNVTDNNCTGDPTPELVIDDLMPGQIYYVRVWAENGGPDGTFGIILSETLPTLVDFTAFSDALIVDDCIELTQSSQGQQGCAWYQNLIDFSQPFSHTMTANFGSSDLGADGICLVYQSNGQDFCGGTGSGIGAGGMPNSAIIEFDTYQNGIFADPFDDHCAFNTNGDMNHPNSINGPISLGNIEDGLDHTITFDWNPAGNQYSVSFDQVIVLSGSYDIITNCFGGSDQAWWGYTSATGAAVNKHVICPLVDIYSPATVSHEELIICQGESYNGYSDTGFYIYTEIGPDGCSHQSHLDLTVVPEPSPTFLDTSMCAGSLIYIGDQEYSGAGGDIIQTVTSHGCDSIIYIEIEEIAIGANIESPSDLNCDQSQVQLAADVSSNLSPDNISYSWAGPGVMSTSPFWDISDPGLYTLTATFHFGNIACQTSDQVLISQDIVPPQVDPLADIELNCSNIDSVFLLTAESSSPNLVTSWYYNDTIISTQFTTENHGSGTYIFVAQDSVNHCRVADTIVIAIDDDIPVISLSATDLNCDETTTTPTVSIDGTVTSYTWTLTDSLVSNDSTILISEAGTYTLTVANDIGCQVSQNVTVHVDTLQPTLHTSDSFIPCDSSSTVLIADVGDNSVITWSHDSNILSADTSLQVQSAGLYFATARDTVTGCIHTDTVTVQDHGSSPDIELFADTLTCGHPTVLIQSISAETDISYTWTSGGNIVGSDTDSLVVSNAGQYELITTTTNGCSSTDSIDVVKDVVAPSLDIFRDTITCAEPMAFLSAISTPVVDIYWILEDGSYHYNDTIATTAIGQYIAVATNSDNMCTTTDTIDLVSNILLPAFSLSTDTITCMQENLALPFMIDNNFESITWNGPDGFTSSERTPMIDAAGTYNLQIKVETDCFIDTSLIVAVDTTRPEYQVTYDSITCSNPIATITTLLADSLHDIRYETTTGGIYTDSTIQINEGGAITLEITDPSNGCIITEVIDIMAFTEEPPLAVEADEFISCATPTAQANITTDINNITIAWSYQDSIIGTDAVLNMDFEGAYHVMVANKYGCTSDTVINVEAYFSEPDLSLEGEDLDCINTSAVLHLITDEPSSGRWSGPNLDDIMATELTVQEGGWYYCSIMDEYGCEATDSIFINSNQDIPQLTLLSSDTVIVDLEGEPQSIEIDVDSSSDYDLYWTPESDLSCSDCHNPTILSSTTNLFTVDAISEYGCVDQLTIPVLYVRAPKVTIPNIFSPLSDGPNRMFTLYGNSEIKLISSMKIYDRWGNLVAVFENILPNDPSIGWNGNHNLQPVTEGVYVYQILAQTKDGTVLTFLGDVTVVH